MTAAVANVNDYQIKNFLGLNWLLIFYHDSHGALFFNEKEAHYSIQKNKFSLFDKISDSFQFENESYVRVYEFLLEYPELEGFNRWQQVLFPSDPRTRDQPLGYNPLNITWPNSYFEGMALSNQTNLTFIDGSPKSDTTWHFAIGSYQAYTYADKFPGPCLSNGCPESFYYVKLWLRMEDFSLLKYLNPIFQRCTCQCHFRILYSILFITFSL